MNKFELPCEQKAYKCGIYIYRGFYDAAWADTNKKHPRPRNLELPRDLFDWHYFYQIFLDSLPLLTEEQELELLIRWQQDGDIEARNHLILSLARITGPIAGRAVARRFPMLNGEGWLEAVHEIIGWGNLGLVDAPSKMTLSRGYRLSTVANQWIKKYIHDGLASLVSVIYYPERKRSLAKFDSQLAAKSPGEDGDFEAFDSFGDPTNPELKLGYLQRQVGKRLFPWHDWGADWELLGVKDRFEISGGVSLEVPKRESDRQLPSGSYTLDPIKAFLEEWVRYLFEGQTYFGKRDAVELNAEICLIDNRQGRYCSRQHYAKPKPIAPEVVRLVEHVCTDTLRDNSWRDVPERRQLDAYCHWDKRGHRVDKPTWLRRHVRVSSVDGRETEALARRGANLAPVDWLAHTADGIAPDSWNITRHWRTTYPLAFDDLRRPKFCTSEHDYFALLYGKFGLPPKPYPESQPTKCRAPKKKDGPKSNIYVHCLYLARRARKQQKGKTTYETRKTE